jgi:phospholipid/cholesterol/gamma-HCH transport system substrate-binding protein
MEETVKPLPERTRKIMQNLDEGTDRLNRSLKNLGDLLRFAVQTDGAFRRFLTNPELYNRLNTAACMLTKLLPRLDPILSDLEVFADKIARHPETLGVRGAIRPSSGVKLNPCAPLYGRGSDH